MERPNNFRTEIFGTTARSIVILIVGLVFFGRFTYVVFTIPKQVDSIVSATIIYVLELLFLLFFVFSLYYIFQIKVVIIDEQGLTINYPLRFLKVNVPFQKIFTVTLLPQVINANISYGITTIYRGNKILIEFDDKKKLRIDSFQTRNFERLLELLMRQKRKFSS